MAMAREHEKQDRRPHAATPERRVAVRFARAEVVDVLAEGLWSLILAGRWPGAADGDGRGPSTSSDTAQPVESAWV